VHLIRGAYIRKAKTNDLHLQLTDVLELWSIRSGHGANIMIDTRTCHESDLLVALTTESKGCRFVLFHHVDVVVIDI